MRMVMRRRQRAAAWLHLAAGLFVAATTGSLWMSAALLAPTFDGSFIPDLVAMVGRPIAVALIGVGLLEVTGAVALLRGHHWGRVALMVISVLQLPVFPVGTALAAGTAWAFFG